MALLAAGLVAGPGAAGGQEPLAPPAELEWNSSLIGAAAEGAVLPATERTAGYVSVYHELQREAGPLRFASTAGLMDVKRESGEARVFFTLYERIYPRGERPRQRPLTFAFNGGPGASSLWLHFSLGPKRVLLTDSGRSLPPPYELVPNEHTWLDFTDLVFVDPIGTGYSEPRASRNPAEFYGMQQDIEWNAEFIRAFLGRFRRWSAPLFLAGESYGALRSVGLAGHLQKMHGVDMSGLVLISYPLDFRTMVFNAGDDVPYALFLPSYCATALAFRRLAPEYQKSPETTIEAAEAWAMGEYSQGLFKGDKLSPSERRDLLKKLAGFTGLSVGYLDSRNLRVTNREFIRELLRNEGEFLGWCDSRCTTTAEYEIPQGDPALLEATGPYVATWQDYAVDYLRFQDPVPYEHCAYPVNMLWDWGPDPIALKNFFDPLRQMMNQNRHLRIMVACGQYDLNTPYLATIHSINRLGLSPSLHQNIAFHRYPAGHMIYTDLSSMIRLRRDVEGFYTRSLGDRVGFVQAIPPPAPEGAPPGP